MGASRSVCRCTKGDQTTRYRIRSERLLRLSSLCAALLSVARQAYAAGEGAGMQPSRGSAMGIVLTRRERACRDKDGGWSRGYPTVWLRSATNSELPWRLPKVARQSRRSRPERSRGSSVTRRSSASNCEATRRRDRFQSSRAMLCRGCVERTVKRHGVICTALAGSQRRDRRPTACVLRLSSIR